MQINVIQINNPNPVTGAVKVRMNKFNSNIELNLLTFNLNNKIFSSHFHYIITIF